MAAELLSHVRILFSYSGIVWQYIKILDPQSVTWLISGGLMMAILAASVVVITRVSVRKLMEEEQRRILAGLEHQRELLRVNIETQESERERISADLHDSLASKLQVARLMLSTGTKDPHATTASVKELIDEVIENSRQIAYDLYPQSLSDFGLLHVVKELLRPLTERLKIVFASTGTQYDTALGKEKEAHIFRIVQEVIHNSLKHAKATTITMTLRITSCYFSMIVADDGVGFALNVNKTGHGLKNIESRVQLLNGTFKIKSGNAQGTRLILLIRKVQEK